jgi:hypothetical protein
MALFHLAVVGGLTAGTLALRRGLEWLLLGRRRPATPDAQASPTTTANHPS